MSLIAKANPALRARGLIFHEDFESAASVIENGGVVTGTPLTTKGRFLGGGTNSLNYPTIQSQLSALGKLSVLIKDLHLPSNVTADQIVVSTVFDGNLIGWVIWISGGLLYFHSNGRGGNIAISSGQILGDTVFVFDGSQPDATKLILYLNGVPQAVPNNFLSALGPTSDSLKLSGAGNAAYKLTGGSFGPVSIYNAALTSDEVMDLHSNSSFVYEKRSSLILPMRLQDHDISNVRTLDVSGRGNHFTLGDGVTPATYPTKLTSGRGYSFDGVNDYVVSACTVGDLLTAGEGTIIVTMKALAAAPVAGIPYLGSIILMDRFAAAGGYIHIVQANIGGLDRIWVCGFDIAERQIGVEYGIGETMVIGWVHHDGNLYAYKNGVLIGTVALSGAIWLHAPHNIYIGAPQILGTPFNGEIYGVEMSKNAMTEIQMKDYSLRTLKGLR